MHRHYPLGRRHDYEWDKEAACSECWRLLCRKRTTTNHYVRARKNEAIRRKLKAAKCDGPRHRMHVIESSLALRRFYDFQPSEAAKQLYAQQLARQAQLATQS